MQNHETEVRFLEIDKDALIKKLKSLGAVDHGEFLLEETIIYDKALAWRDEMRLVRIRKANGKTKLAYKEHLLPAQNGAKEIELDINDPEKAIAFLEELGFAAFRRQEKWRRTFLLGNVIFDIDTWPKLPTYVELEGPTIEALRNAARSVEFDWEKVVYEDARSVIENVYHIPVGSLRWFTFDKIE